MRIMYRMLTSHCVRRWILVIGNLYKLLIDKSTKANQTKLIGVRKWLVRRMSTQLHEAALRLIMCNMQSCGLSMVQTAGVTRFLAVRGHESYNTAM